MCEAHSAERHKRRNSFRRILLQLPEQNWILATDTIISSNIFGRNFNLLQQLYDFIMVWTINTTQLSVMIQETECLLVSIIEECVTVVKKHYQYCHDTVKYLTIVKMRSSCLKLA